MKRRDNNRMLERATIEFAETLCLAVQPDNSRHLTAQTDSTTQPQLARLLLDL
ncbi:hypothetical protein D3C76_1550510 [compost metagenome]